ncbi:MAG: FCD domain-containing protein [Pseudomonadota bacterium]
MTIKMVSEMPFKIVETPNVSDATALQIRELIALDILKPGDVLPGERDLCDRMGISRTTLRTALKALTTEGLLISKRGSGLRVSENLGASISDPMVTLLNSIPRVRDDYLKFRILLETACASEVAASGNESDCARIVEINQQMLEAIEAGDLSKARQADAEFHMAIIEASGNVVSIQVARSLYDLMQSGVELSHRLSHESRITWQALAQQHVAICTALENGDPTVARDAMRLHLEHQRTLAEAHQRQEEQKLIVSMRREWDSEKDI